MQIHVDRQSRATQQLTQAVLSGAVSVAQIDSCCASKLARSRLLGTRTQSSQLDMPNQVSICLVTCVANQLAFILHYDCPSLDIFGCCSESCLTIS